MNWGLLRATFPGHIAEPPPTLQTVPVKVRAGRDVILVLSSYHTASWVVDVESGGRVVGVILCGYDPQQVSGVDAPIVYRAAYSPNGDNLPSGMEILQGYRDFNWKTGSPLPAALVAGARELTGKELTSFQFSNQASKDGFMVKPGAK